MDPNANLQEQETLLTSFGNYVADPDRLSDLRQALYDWIRDGGFEPDWTQAPNARQYYGR